MKHALFYKSYERDKPWLDYALRSVEKFCRRFDETVVVMPEGQHFKHQIARVVEIREPADCNHYLFQQSTKLHADAITDAEFITFSDSDTIFTRPVSPEMFFTDGKLNWLITPYADVDTPWQLGAAKFLKEAVEFETMRRFPVTIPSWLLADVRAFCRVEHKMELSEYVMAQEPPNPAFSEFNILGAYAHAFHLERFNWIDTSQVPESEWPPLVVLQKYSHSGLTPEIEAEFETILTKEFISSKLLKCHDNFSTLEVRHTPASHVSDSSQRENLTEIVGSFPEECTPVDGANESEGPANTVDRSEESANLAHSSEMLIGPSGMPSDMAKLSSQINANAAGEDRREGSCAATTKITLLDCQSSGSVLDVMPKSTCLKVSADQTPWANREESIAEVKRLASRLKAFQGNNPGKVRFVRILLQQQGVIVLSYRRKKRKGWKRAKK